MIADLQKKMTSIFKHATPSFLALAFMVLCLIVQCLYCFAKCDSRRVLLAGIVFIAFLVVIYALFLRFRLRSENVVQRLFLVLLCGLGVTYLAVFTPGTIPDESYHYLQAYNLSNSLLFVPSSDEGILMRSCDIAMLNDGAVYGRNLKASTIGSVLSSISGFSEESTLEVYETPFAFDIGSNPFQQRFAPAIAITVARIFNLDPILTYYLGRLFNLGLFVALAFFSAKIIPVGKKSVMVISLLPMTLHLAASYSYDCFIIGMSLLFVSVACRGIFLPELFGRRDIAVASISIFLLAPCKIIYALLVLLVFLIPRSRFESAKDGILAKSIIIASGIASIVLFKIGMVLNLLGVTNGTSSSLGVFAYNPYGDGVDFRGWGAGAETGSFYTISDILRDPFGTVGLFLRSFDQLGDSYIQTTWGGVLGWLQLGSPYFYTLIFLLLVLISCIRSKDDDAIIPGYQRAIFLILFILGVGASMLGMMLGHTFSNESVIMGVQGRYFLPFLLLLCLALRLKHFKCDVDLSFWCPYALCSANMFYMLRVISEIALL